MSLSKSVFQFFLEDGNKTLHVGKPWMGLAWMGAKALCAYRISGSVCNEHAAVDMRRR